MNASFETILLGSGGQQKIQQRSLRLGPVGPDCSDIFLYFLHFSRPCKNVPRWPQMGPGRFFSGLSRPCRHFGRHAFDFDDFDNLDFGDFGDFSGSQISRFSRFTDSWIPRFKAVI